MSDESVQHGKTLLSSVERLLDQDAVERTTRRILAVTTEREEASKRVISHYANRSAIAGALSAAPGLVPGWGTLGVVGLTLAELSYVMKVEVEMCLGLCAIHGHDIRRLETRQLALALAAVEVHRVEAGRNVVLDLGEVSVQALLNYTPRELSKLTARFFGWFACQRAAQWVGKSVLRAVPAVGSVVGFGMNALLTRRVGKAAHLALREHEQQSVVASDSTQHAEAIQASAG